MKRIVTFFLFCFVMFSSLVLSVSAAYPPLMDPAMILSDQEQNDLQEQCLRLREEIGMDVAICITDTLEGKSAQDFADDWYDDHNYSDNGVLFLLAMEEREWHISTCGKAMELLSDDELDTIGSFVVPYLSDGLYYQGFTCFLEILPQFLERGDSSAGYESDYIESYEDRSSDVNLILSMGIGAVAAGIALLIMRSTMNTRTPKRGAEDYETQGSYRLTQHQDLFLYSNVSKVRRQQSSGSGSSAHRSSSGRSHGGRGGKF